MRQVGATARRDTVIDPTTLVSIDKQIIEPDRAKLIARQVAPARTGDNPGTEKIVFRKLSRDGVAKIFSFTGMDNIPLVDQYATPYEQAVRSIVVGFTVTVQDVRAGQMAGVPVAANKIATAKEAAATKENSVFFNGDAQFGIEGLLAYTGIQTHAVVTGVGGFTWALKTPLEILKDVRTVWGLVQHQDNYRATILILNTGMMAYLYQPMTATSDITVFEHIQRQGWFPAGIVTSECIPAGTFVVMQNTPDILHYALPLDLDRTPMSPYIINGMTEEVDLEERYGGALVYRPLGVCVATGIA